MPTAVRLAFAALLFLTAPLRADDWPQWLGPQRDGVWRETDVIDKFPASGPKFVWKVPVGAGYSGPAVADGRVYLTDRVLPEGTRNPANAFARGEVPGTERVLCLDEKTGQVLWKHEYDCPYRISYPSGPRATPLVAGGKAYVLGAMGDLFCFDAAKGDVLWKLNFVRDFKAPVPVWGFAAHPLLDGDKLICLVGGEGSVAVALHKDTGKELWRSLSASEIGYCPPMIYTLAGRRQYVVWHPDAVNGLEPETGKPIWTQPFTSKAGLSIPTPRVVGNRLFITAFYDGSLMLEFPGDGTNPTVVWQGKSKSEMPDHTDGLHGIMPTPFWVGDYIYGVCSFGELRCLEAATGKRVWQTLRATRTADTDENLPKSKYERWGNAFLVQNGDRFFIFNEKGDLIVARLTPAGYDEVSRAHVIEPTNPMAGRPTVWTHPAFANGRVYVRNDKELVCVDLKR